MPSTEGPHGTGKRARRPDLRAARAALPEPVRKLIDDYERHLSLERGLSAHTVRAYLGDVVSLLGFVDGNGGRFADLDIATLRGWLARQREEGASRTTLARRAAAA